MRKLLAAAVGTAVTLAALLAAASVLTARESHPKAAPAAARTLFGGIEQHGAALGSPSAPVTLVEYADLQCPYCAEWARSALPAVVHRYVRTGKVRLVFNGLAFIGPDSLTALRTAVAAGQQDHLWDVVDGLYARQGAENSGWVTDDLVAGLGVPDLDTAQVFRTRDDASVESAIRDAYDDSQAADIHSTPSFRIGATGGTLSLARVGSLDAAGITPLIDEALGR